MSNPEQNAAVTEAAGPSHNLLPAISNATMSMLPLHKLAFDREARHTNPRTILVRPVDLRAGALSQSTTCWFRRAYVCVATAVFFLLTLSIATAEPKRLLLVHSFGRDFAPWSEYAKNFRAELDRQWREPVDLYEASLAIARSQTTRPEGPFIDYLRALFGNHWPDLILAIGAPAVNFFQQHRPQLFPSTPMLLMGAEERIIAPGGNLTANDTVVAHSLDIPGVVENVLRVLPKTTNIAVVIGNSPVETCWLGQMHGALQPFTDRVAFTWFNELSFDEMLKRVAALPPRSTIFFALLSVDAADVPHEKGKALTGLHAVTNAPIFSYDDGYFGHGIVRGPLIPA